MDGSEAQISYQIDSQTTSSAMANVDTQRPMYTVPGILHFLQHEWTRFEIERQQWETERAEFQARIAFLQGERQGQENLKSALVRRIKMLEYALKQERLKFNKLKYGSENVPLEDQKPTSNEAQNFDDDENKEDPNLGFGDNSVSFKQGRQLLRQYLKEIGYVDTIIDIRSTAVKKLLGIKSETNFNGNNNNNNNNISLNGDFKSTNESKRIIPNIVKNATSDLSKSVLASLVFLKEDQPDEDSSDDDIDASRIMVKPSDVNTTNHNTGLDTLNDLDSEEVALHEFDFLTGDAATSGNINQMKSNETNSDDWDVDQSRLNRLKEEYKRDRHGKQHQHHTTNSSSIRNNLLDNGNDDTSSDQRTFSTDEQINREMVDTMMFRNSKNFMGDTAMDSLDELARVTVLNDNEPQDDTTTTDSSDFRKIWNVKYVLRSHLDGIRCVTFHPVESVVITGSEDRTLKLWNLEKSAVLRKSASTTQDLEPIYTFRRHTGPVLCVAMNPSGEQCYSGGLDSIISVWNIPNSDVDAYDSYDSNVLCKVLEGHTDAIWQLVISGQKLLSCSSDGSIRLWDPNLIQPLQSIFHNDGIPISIDWLMQDTNQFVATYDSLKTILYDTETGKVVSQFGNDNSTLDPSYRINKIMSHPSQPIIITAHEDRKIRYFDSNSGRIIHSMVAHLDTVTSLAIDPQQTCLLSGSHDRSIRLWNLETKNCIQELTAHQKKDDESIHDVAFHLSKPYMASVGADSIAKIYA
ncbi:unnamed protein product [Rotaria sordida]|uniref:Striatin N-terminal domain-containing protein n=1 Tax=Rotaria sordida TaxID=392033 RepID=A0A813T8H5_9BILA|nr:unnamed protein product [Rotaria sordida]